MSKKLILGSASPRRKDLLQKAGFSITVFPINTDENYPQSMESEQVAEHLALKKSKAYTHKIDDSLLITADTVVILNNTILNKPVDIAEAKKMLSALSGQKHSVNTGVCIRNNDKGISFTESTEVHFKTLNEKEIDYYIKNYNPFDKAGSYGIQDWIGLVGINKIEGCYYNVMGFPVARFCEELKLF